jgi:zinc protease
MKENGYWLSNLSSAYLYDLDPKRILTYEDRIKKLKPADLTKIAAKYLNAPNKLKCQWIPELKP